MGQIKINRAMRLSAIGRYPGSAQAMMDAIPGPIKAALPSSQLAVLMDAMWGACCEAKAIALRDAVAEGAIWDVSGGRLRDIAI